MLLLSVALLLVIALPFVVWAATDDADPAQARTGLVLERYVDPETLRPEIVAYLPEHGLNKRDVVPSGRVAFKCFDGAGKTVLSTTEKWPLTTDLGGALPHAHRPVSSEVLETIRRCTLDGGRLRITGARFR